MKHYYVKYIRNASNWYSLVYTETEEQSELALANGYERITRRQAEKLAAQERFRRKYDPSFAYHADADIFPFGVYADFNNYPWTRDGYLIVHA